MGFPLTEEQKMVQQMVREFARNRLEPEAARMDREEIFPAEQLKAMGELGLMGMMIPVENGGGGVGAVAYSLAITEIAYACAATAVTMSVNNLTCDPICKLGTAMQKADILEPLASGRWLSSFAITEPGSGSDSGSLTMRAVRDGDDYILNGTKMFITNGAYADVILTIARTDPDQGKRGLTAFLVHKGTKGFSVGAAEDKMGLRASNTVELIYEDVRIPAAMRLGDEGEGFKIAMMALDGGRVGIASQSVGIGRACLDEAVRYAKERQQFGHLIADNQAIQWMLADTATELEAAKLLTLRAADLKEQEKPFTREASMAKVYASEMANRAAFRAVQVHGGYGYSKHFKVERLYRDARITTIYEGTSEVQRLVISRSLLTD